MKSFRQRFRLRRLTWVGLMIAAVGCAPLLAVITPNPNPVGLGILAACTFWPGIALAVAGAVWSAVDVRRQRSGSGV